MHYYLMRQDFPINCKFHVTSENSTLSYSRPVITTAVQLSTSLLPAPTIKLTIHNCIIIRPHHMQSIRCSLLLQMLHVAYLSVCISHTDAVCAKTAELIEVVFRG